MLWEILNKKRDLELQKLKLDESIEKLNITLTETLIILLDKQSEQPQVLEEVTDQRKRVRSEEEKRAQSERIKLSWVKQKALLSRK